MLSLADAYYHIMTDTLFEVPLFLNLVDDNFLLIDVVRHLK